jgi:hypothetical protein
VELRDFRQSLVCPRFLQFLEVLLHQEFLEYLQFLEQLSRLPIYEKRPCGLAFRLDPDLE